MTNFKAFTFVLSGVASVLFANFPAHAVGFGFGLTLQGDTKIEGVFEVEDDGDGIFTFGEVSNFMATAVNTSENKSFTWYQSQLSVFNWETSTDTFILRANNLEKPSPVNLFINTREIAVAAVEETELGGFSDFLFFNTGDTSFITPQEIITDVPEPSSIPEPTATLSLLALASYLLGKHHSRQGQSDSQQG